MPGTPQRRIFITGTDTEVGKTFFTAALTTALQQSGQSVVAFKPIAAGCEWVDGQLKNEDALALIEAMNEILPYKVVNPITLIQPVAPHISAKLDGEELSVDRIQQVCPLADYSQSHILVEGAGGWLVPLNARETFADYVKQEELDVILVVGLKLGCINHALLTQQSITSQGLNLIGWVANHIDPKMQSQKQNIGTLKQMMNCPLVAEIPYIDHGDRILLASNYVRIESFN